MKSFVMDQFTAVIKSNGEAWKSETAQVIFIYLIGRVMHLQQKLLPLSNYFV